VDHTKRLLVNSLDLLCNEHPFGVKEYCFSDSFTREDVENLINCLEEKYYSTGKILKNVPGLQTVYTIFSEEKFKKVQDTFLQCVRQYVNQKQLIDNLDSGNYNVNSWCYKNWRSSGYNDESPEWHVHNKKHPDAITGIFYLKLPQSPGGETKFHLGGNEFELPSNELSWFLFPSNYPHAPGAVFSNERRYCISADIWFDSLIWGNWF